MTWSDETDVHIYLTSKGDQKSTVVVQHQKLANKAAADAMKEWWNGRLKALADTLVQQRGASAGVCAIPRSHHGYRRRRGLQL